MKLTVFCPRCKSGVLNMRALTDSDQRIYAYRGTCTDCGSYTDLGSSANGVIDAFRRGLFTGVARSTVSS